MIYLVITQRGNKEKEEGDQRAKESKKIVFIVGDNMIKRSMDVNSLNPSIKNSWPN